MKQLVFAALGMAFAAVMSGCATVYRVSETPAAIPQGPASAGPVMRNPTVAVKSDPADAKSKPMAAALRAAVERDLAARGFDVHAKPPTPVDSVLALSVSRREAARLADWRTYEGSVTARITEGGTGRLVAGESFKALGDRALDEKSAEASACGKLAPQLSRWLAKVLPAAKVPVPQPPPPSRAVAMIRLAPADPCEDHMDALRVQRRFMDGFAAHPGVLSCSLAQEQSSRNEFMLRVEYDPNSFPGGLLNTVVLDNPRIAGDVKLEIVR